LLVITGIVIYDFYCRSYGTFSINFFVFCLFFFCQFIRYVLGSKNEFRQQILDLSIFPYHYLEVPKISPKKLEAAC